MIEAAHIIAAAHIMVVLIPLFPLVALLVGAAGGSRLPVRFARGTALAGCGLSAMAALAAVVLCAFADEAQAIEVFLFQWISISGERPLSVWFSLRADSLSLVMLLCVLSSATLALWHARRDLERRELEKSSVAPRYHALVSLLVLATCMLLLSGNLLQLLLFWQLTAVCGGLLYAVFKSADGPPVTTWKSMLVDRAGDGFLLIGACLVWRNFGTLELGSLFGGDESLLDQFLSEGIPAALLDRNRAIVAMIGIGVFWATAVRCAQFPFIGRIAGASRFPGWLVALYCGSCVMPAGIYVVMRFGPLLAASAEVRQMVSSIAGVTVLFSSIMAAAQTDLKRVFGFSTVSLFGFMLLGTASEHSSGQLAAVLLLVVHTFAGSALYLVSDQVAAQTGGSTRFDRLGGLRLSAPGAYAAFLIAIVVLSSGLWGQSALLASYGIQPGNPATDSGFGLHRKVLVASSTLAVMLTAFALFRAFFLTFHNKPRPDNNDLRNLEKPTITRTAAALMLVLLAVAAGPLMGQAARLSKRISGLDNPWLHEGASDSSPAFTIEFGSLAALLGMVVAWMLYWRVSAERAHIGRIGEPLGRLVRHRFYLDNIGRTLMLPSLRKFAHGCRLVDRHLIQWFVFELPAQLAILFSKSARPMHNGVFQLYAISLVLATAVVLVVSLWLKG